MARRNFYEIIKSAGINITKEYNRINELFETTESGQSVRDLIEEAFLEFPKSFRGRTISLEDFDETFGFHKKMFMGEVSLEELLLRCEYIINLCVQLNKYYALYLDDTDQYNIKLLIDTINECIDELGFMKTIVEGVIIYIEKDAAVISVAEILPEHLAISVLEYNHYRLKGDLIRKRKILKEMADNIEPERKRLREINNTLETQLFQLLNKFIRHDHSQTPYIATMKDRDIEEVYDDIYQLWLFAKLNIDNITRRDRMKDLLNQINS